MSIDSFPRVHYNEQAPERESIRDGVDFSKCQMKNIIAAYASGEKLDIEAVSPYLIDYNTHTGEMWGNLLTPVDATGIEIAKLLRTEFPRARMVSLYDEYNSEFTDSSDASGKPTRDAAQLPFSDGVKRNFRASFEQVLRAQGVINDMDKEGESYLLISESEKVHDVEKLIERLEGAGHIRRDGTAIYFENAEAENPEHRTIVLRTKNGRWLCEALDASSFLNPENLEMTHLVILPNSFKKQQDKVWEILRTLGIAASRYHNIFFDENVPAEHVTRVIQEEILQARQ